MLGSRQYLVFNVLWLRREGFSIPLMLHQTIVMAVMRSFCRDVQRVCPPCFHLWQFLANFTRTGYHMSKFNKEKIVFIDFSLLDMSNRTQNYNKHTVLFQVSQTVKIMSPQNDNWPKMAIIGPFLCDNHGAITTSIETRFEE